MIFIKLFLFAIKIFSYSIILWKEISFSIHNNYDFISFQITNIFLEKTSDFIIGLGSFFWHSPYLFEEK